MIKNQTTLDLNGPVLSFSQQPVSISTCNAGVAVTFVGIATATFPTQSPSNPATGSGYISYQWYLNGHGSLTDTVIKGSRISGSASTTLTIYSPKSPTISGSDLYLRADYIPSAYSQPVGSAVTVGSARSTGNAVFDPIDSNMAELTVYPVISVSSQPSNKSEVLDTPTSFSISVQTTDSAIGELSYNWQINGVDITSSNTTAQYISPASDKFITIQDSVTGSRNILNFRNISSYSDFVSGREYTLTPASDIQLNIYAVGGGGGEETYRGAQGGKGGHASGTVTLLRDQTYKLIIGGGAVNQTGGYGGGGNGNTGGAGGFSGGGGGYTGLFLGSVSQENAILIAGGGGGAANGPAQGGNGGGTVGGNSSNVSGNGGSGGTQSSGGAGRSAGSALQGGSGGAAGGGGGYYGGGSGSFSSGCCSDGAGGGGSGYLNPSLVTNGSFSQTNENAGGGNSGQDGSFRFVLSGVSTGTADITASGFTTPNLTISSKTEGIFQIGCKVTHSLSCNSPLYSKKVNYSAITPRNILNFEYIDATGTSEADLSSVDLGEFGCTTLTAENTGGRIISFYAPEKDVEVTIDMKAPKGRNSTSYSGGNGGTSLFNYVLKRNVEYVLAPLPFSGSNGGLYLYEKANLLAVVGSGGDAGSSSNGGSGGGVINAGQNGQGRNGGLGGEFIREGTLPTSGYFPNYWTGEVVNPDSINTTPNGGGRVISCTRGDYWRTQGFSSCEDVGKQKFVRGDGNIVGNTTDTITRGFKANYGIRQTSGRGDANSGNGGFGAVGGNGGTSGAGGGGGSGYHNGNIKVLESTVGGNNGSAKVVICTNIIAGLVEWGGTYETNVSFSADKLSYSYTNNTADGWFTYSTKIPDGNVYFDVRLSNGFPDRIGRFGITSKPDIRHTYFSDVDFYLGMGWEGVLIGTYTKDPTQMTTLTNIVASRDVPSQVSVYSEGSPYKYVNTRLTGGDYRLAINIDQNKLYLKKLSPESDIYSVGPLPTPISNLRIVMYSQAWPGNYPPIPTVTILNSGRVYRGGGGLY